MTVHKIGNYHKFLPTCCTDICILPKWVHHVLTQAFLKLQSSKSVMLDKVPLYSGRVGMILRLLWNKTLSHAHHWKIEFWNEDLQHIARIEKLLACLCLRSPDVLILSFLIWLLCSSVSLYNLDSLEEMKTTKTENLSTAKELKHSSWLLKLAPGVSC